jgi:hypothetical protein
MACAICKIRREKRHCPGVPGEICPTCCGTQREETVDCPINCEYLLMARQRQILPQDPAAMPNREFDVPDGFVKKNIELVTLIDYAVLQGASKQNAIDFDVREALDSLIRTYKTLGSGLYYESRPVNPMAAAIYDSVQQQVAEIRRLENERGLHKFRDSDLLTALVFLQKIEYTFNNGRKKGRAFLSQLLGAIPKPEKQPPASSLLIS